MGKGEDALDVLRSIDATLKSLLALAQLRSSQSRGVQPKAIASDRDLDGQYGDPLLKFSPRDWTGDSFKDCRFSQCPAPLLEMVAETLDYFADRAEQKGELTTAGKPTAPYKRADAARARGWAKRIKEGWHAPATAHDDSPAWATLENDGEGF